MGFPKIKLIFQTLLLLLTIHHTAQETLLSSGSTTNEGNGTVSYSVGQIAYTKPLTRYIK